MDEAFLITLLITFKLAGLTTLVLLVIGIPLAYFLVYAKSWFKNLVEAVVSLPIVLPPTVIGFYLLVAFSADHPFGHYLMDTFGIRLNFTFTGILIGSIIYSLPFMVHPLQAGLQHLPPSLKEASWSLGKSWAITLFRVLLPNIKPALLSGIVLSFAHTVGEFGLILMIGGNIPGKTRVASIAIYDEVESLNYGMANQYAMVLILIAFFILFMLFYLNRKYLSKKDYD